MPSIFLKIIEVINSTCETKRVITALPSAPKTICIRRVVKNMDLLGPRTM